MNISILHLIASSPLILENVKLAKQMVQAGKLSSQTLEELIQIDPSASKKYVGWMAKQWDTGQVNDINELEELISRYDVLVKRGRITVTDINQFKDLKDLYSQVVEAEKVKSKKVLAADTETVIDDADLLVMVPHTHEASRKIGNAYFAYRVCDDGSKDSAWCTTYRLPDHFNNYYYNDNITFYYYRVRSADMVRKLQDTFPTKWEALVVGAIMVIEQDGDPDGKVREVWDGANDKHTGNTINKLLQILEIS